MALDLTSLRKAVSAMELVLARSEDAKFMESLDEIARNAIRAGVIQHFEFTYELCWKFIQRWIRGNVSAEEANHPRTRKDIFRMAAERNLVSDPAVWFEYAEARNATSHTYDVDKAGTVYDTAKRFVKHARELLDILEASND